MAVQKPKAIADIDASGAHKIRSEVVEYIDYYRKMKGRAPEIVTLTSKQVAALRKHEKLDGTIHGVRIRVRG